MNVCVPSWLIFFTIITIDITVNSASSITMVTFVTKVKSAAVILMVVKVASVPIVTR